MIQSFDNTGAAGIESLVTQQSTVRTGYPYCSGKVTMA